MLQLLDLLLLLTYGLQQLIQVDHLPGVFRVLVGTTVNGGVAVTGHGRVESDFWITLL